MSWLRVRTVVRRNFVVLWRNPARWFDIAVWPLFDILGHSLPRHRSRAMQHVGFVAGYLPLPDRVTVGEALGLFAGFYGLAGQAAADAVAGGLERFGVAHLAEQYCMELSSGQRTICGARWVMPNRSSPSMAASCALSTP